MFVTAKKRVFFKGRVLCVSFIAPQLVDVSITVHDLKTAVVADFRCCCCQLLQSQSLAAVSVCRCVMLSHPFPSDVCKDVYRHVTKGRHHHHMHRFLVERVETPSFSPPYPVLDFHLTAATQTLVQATTVRVITCRSRSRSRSLGRKRGEKFARVVCTEV